MGPNVYAEGLSRYNRSRLAQGKLNVSNNTHFLFIRSRSLHKTLDATLLCIESGDINQFLIHKKTLESLGRLTNYKSW